MSVDTANPVEGLEWRYATKKFDPDKKIDAETWDKIEQALILSPSSFGLQPWKFVVVSNPEIKEKLVSSSWNQNQPKDCSHLVVICRVEPIDATYVNHYIQCIANERGVDADSLSAYKDMMIGSVTKMSAEQQKNWTSAQCYIALGILMSAASALHVDNCPMEGFVKEDYDRILGLPEKGCHSVVVCALGYRADDDKYASAKKVRFPAQELVIKI